MSAYARFNHSPIQEPTRIHAIDIANSLEVQLEMIKIIHRHHNEGRWVLLLAPTTLPGRQLMDSCHINRNHVLVVHHRKISDCRQTLLNAIRLPNFAAIVCPAQQFLPADMATIAACTRKNRSHFYYFR